MYFQLHRNFKKWTFHRVNTLKHWRIEGGAKGALPPPPPLPKIGYGVVNSRLQTNKV